MSSLITAKRNPGQISDRLARASRKISEEELSKIGKIEASEKEFRLKITGLNLWFVGFIDLIGRIGWETSRG